jgi:hypothetical protein
MPTIGNEGGSSNGAAALDTIQVINSATSTNASAWGSTIPCTFTAPGQTLTLPAIATTDIGKSIAVQNAGTNSFLLAIASGVINSAIGSIISPGSTFVIKALSAASAIVISTNAAQNVVPENGTTVNTTGNTSYPANSALITFTLPSVGRFDVDAQIGANFSAVGSGNLYLRTSAGAEVPNSRIYVQNGAQGAMAAPIHVNAQIDNLAANTTYQLWTAIAWAAVYGYDTPTPAQGGTKVTWNKISGGLPVTGQSVDYLKVKRITSSQVIIANTDVLFNSAPSGNIPYNSATGSASVKANKLYRTRARLVGRNDGTGTTGRFIIYDILTAANAPLPAAANHTQGTQFLATSLNNEGGGSDATAYFMPTVDTDIKVRVTAVDGSNWTLDTERSYFEIEQLGTSVTTKTTLARVQGTFSGALSGSNLLLAGIFDPIGAWNNTTGLFTAPRTADYSIAGGIAFQNTNTYTNGYEILYLGSASSARIAWGWHGAWTGYWGMSGAITVRLTAGQTIAINCTKTSLIQSGVDSNISITELPNDFVN